MSTTVTRPPFAPASPAEIRAAVLVEDREQFDRACREALTDAGQHYRLERLERVLAHWRRIAWAVTTQGPGDYRAMLASADRTLATGERMPGAVPWEQIQDELAL
jgi:hypothetical protein